MTGLAGNDFGGAAVNFSDIESFGGVGAGFDDGLNAKLNLLPEVFCDDGPVGGARVVGVTSVALPFPRL